MVPVEAVVATVFVLGVLWVFWKKYRAILDTVNPKGGLWWMI